LNKLKILPEHREFVSDIIYEFIMDRRSAKHMKKSHRKDRLRLFTLNC